MAQWSPLNTPLRPQMSFFTGIQRGAAEKRKKIVFGLIHVGVVWDLQNFFFSYDHNSLILVKNC